MVGDIGLRLRAVHGLQTSHHRFRALTPVAGYLPTTIPPEYLRQAEVGVVGTGVKNNIDNGTTSMGETLSLVLPPDPIHRTKPLLPKRATGTVRSGVGANHMNQGESACIGGPGGLHPTGSERIINIRPQSRLDGAMPLSRDSGGMAALRAPVDLRRS